MAEKTATVAVHGNSTVVSSYIQLELLNVELLTSKHYINAYEAPRVGWLQGPVKY